MEVGFIFILLLAGALGGFMAGFLGVGGGIVFVPILTFYLEKNLPLTEEFSALVMANSFVVILVIGIVGTLRQRKLGVFHPKAIVFTGIPAIISSLLASRWIVMQGFYSKKIFTLVFLSLLCFVFIRYIIEAFRQKKRAELVDITATIPPSSFIPAGILSGLIAAISGLGGGIVLIPYFTQLLKIPIRIATALSLSVITLGSVPLVVFYLSKPNSTLPSHLFHTGFVLWELVIPLSIGALFTVGFGVRLSKITSPFLLFVVMSAFVLLTMLKLLYAFL